MYIIFSPSAFVFHCTYITDRCPSWHFKSSLLSNPSYFILKCIFLSHCSPSSQNSSNLYSSFYPFILASFSHSTRIPFLPILLHLVLFTSLCVNSAPAYQNIIVSLLPFSMFTTGNLCPAWSVN